MKSRLGWGVALFVALVGLFGLARAEDAKDAAKESAKAEKPASRKARAESKKLDRVTVVGSTGRAAEIPGSVHRITREQLDQQNQAVDDVHRILFRVPGVNITEEEGFGLRPNIGMRGTGTERSANITLMEDAVLIAPAPYAAPAAYYFPTVGRMEGLEIRKGSSQIKYGPRTNGGALNLMSTTPPEDFAGRIRFSYGDFNTRRLNASVGDTWKNLSWVVEAYDMRSDGFKELDNGGNTGFDLQDYNGKLRLRSDDDARIYQEATFKLGYVEQDGNETYLGLTEDDFNSTPYRRYNGSQVDNISTEHQQAMLRYFAMFNENVDATATVYRNEFNRNWYKLDKVEGTGIADILDDPETYAAEYGIIVGNTSADDAMAVKANNREYYSQGVDGILGLDFNGFGASHDLEIGGRVHQDEEDRFQHSDGYRMENGTMVRTTEGVPGLSGGGNNRVNKARAAAGYIQDHMRWSRVAVEAGVRYEYIQTERDQYEAGDPDREDTPTTKENTTEVLVPGLGASYHATDRLIAFAGAHRGFGPPGPGANDETLPETSYNFEAGLRYNDGRSGWEVLGYFNDYENLLGKDTFASGGTGSGDLFNGGAVEIYGAELSARGDVMSYVGSDASFAIPVQATYTYTHSEFQSSFDSDYEPWGAVETGDELPYLPAHQLGLSIGYERSRWGVGVFGNYMSEMRSQAGQGDIPANELIDSRFILDGTVEVGLGGATRLFASAQNLLDEAYVVARRPAGLRPGMPRMVTVGLKLGF